jgi:hypothetical protein
VPPATLERVAVQGPGRYLQGLITTQKDGRRTFITAAELQRYVIPGS